MLEEKVRQLLESQKAKDEELITTKTQLLKFQTDASVMTAEHQTLLHQLKLKNERLEQLNKEISIYRAQAIQLETQGPTKTTKQDILKLQSIC